MSLSSRYHYHIYSKSNLQLQMTTKTFNSNFDFNQITKKQTSLKKHQKLALCSKTLFLSNVQTLQKTTSSALGKYNLTGWDSSFLSLYPENTYLLRFLKTSLILYELYFQLN